MGAVLTITLPGGAEADDSNYGLSFKPLATGADGFTTYEIVDVPKTPTSDEVPYTGASHRFFAVFCAPNNKVQ